MEGGSGDDIYYVSHADDVIVEFVGTAIYGRDTIYSSVDYELGGGIEYLYLTGESDLNGTGNALSNRMYGNDGDNYLIGLAGHDTIDGGSGNDILYGGLGNDTYVFDRSSGLDTIVENDSTAGNKDQLAFAADIAANQLWLTKTGNNLEVSVIGTGNKVVVKDWYLGNAYHVEELKSGNGLTLVNSQVQNLVNAMSSLTPPAAGQTTLPAEYQTQLNAVIASNWQ